MGKLRPIEGQETIQGYRRMLGPLWVAKLSVGSSTERAGEGACWGSPRPCHLLQVYRREAPRLRECGGTGTGWGAATSFTVLQVLSSRPDPNRTICHWHHRFSRVQSVLLRCSVLGERNGLRISGPRGVRVLVGCGGTIRWWQYKISWGRGLSRTSMRRETEAGLQRGSPSLLLTLGCSQGSDSVYTLLLCSLRL